MQSSPLNFVRGFLLNVYCGFQGLRALGKQFLLSVEENLFACEDEDATVNLIRTELIHCLNYDCCGILRIRFNHLTIPHYYLKLMT